MLCSSPSFDKCIRRIRLSVHLSTLQHNQDTKNKSFLCSEYSILFQTWQYLFYLRQFSRKWVLPHLLSYFNLRVVHKCNAGVRLEDDLVANDTIILQGDTCCWICQKCKDYEFVFDKHNCKDCGEGFWPYENKTGCSKLPAKVNTFRVSIIHWLHTYEATPTLLYFSVHPLEYSLCYSAHLYRMLGYYSHANHHW